MVRRTGCAGVVIGRGCLGRPWLFRDLATTFGGEPEPTLPTLGEVVAMMRRHLHLLVHYMGEYRGSREFRKHVAWYLKGFSVPQPIRHNLGLVSSMEDFDALVAGLDPAQPFPRHTLGLPRGRQGSPRPVTLPHGWLDDQDGLTADLASAELDVSGG